MKDFGLGPNDRAPPAPPERAEMPELTVYASLDALDLSQHLLVQYAHVERLRDWCVTDAETPTNQKAQVMNTCTNLLMQLTKMQTELWNAERLKKLEACLFRCLTKLPDHAVAEFMDDYEAAIKELESAA